LCIFAPPYSPDRDPAHDRDPARDRDHDRDPARDHDRDGDGFLRLEVI